MNVITNRTRAASATILHDIRININISEACRIHQRTSPWILVRIPFRTESDYSWTKVDDMTTWTLINCVIEGSNISTLVKFFSTCNNTKMWVRLTLLSRHFQHDAWCITKYEKQVDQLSQTNRAAAWAIFVYTVLWALRSPPTTRVLAVDRLSNRQRLWQRCREL